MVNDNRSMILKKNYQKISMSANLSDAIPMGTGLPFISHD